MRATGYEPLNTLKPVAPGLWVIDGPATRFCCVPFPTRATVARLNTGDLWVHSPTPMTGALKSELDALGPVRHLVAPNTLHYQHVKAWQKAFPDAVSWAAPGVAERATKKGVALAFEHILDEATAPPWDGEMDQMIVAGSRMHREVVFFHHASRTLILTDLIENFETAKLPAWARPLIWIAGIDDSDGKMPPDMSFSFRDKEKLADCVERMIDWAPERILLAHGRCYERNAVAELERAFRRLLRARIWDRELTRAKERE